MAIDPKSDPFQSLRAELEAALAVVTDQVQGLEAFECLGLSPEATEVVDKQLDIRSQRVSYLQALLRALDALVANGYPKLEDVPVNDTVDKEIDEKVHDMKVASDIFVAMRASILKIKTGPIVPKT